MAHQFDEPGEYEIFSSPKFLLKMGERHEVVECEATMRVVTTEARSLASGRRRISFKVTKWEAIGQSILLGGEVKYALADQGSGPITARGSVTSGSGVADLPGKMTVTGTFDAFLNGERVGNSHAGSARGLISNFPPTKGDMFDISGTEVQIGPVIMQGISCDCAKD